MTAFIGKRPDAPFGNSGGDREMLEWTGAGDGARLMMMLVLHDDAEREEALRPHERPAGHEGRHLFPGAIRRGEDEGLDRHQHAVRLQGDLSEGPSACSSRCASIRIASATTQSRPVAAAIKPPVGPAKGVALRPCSEHGLVLAQFVMTAYGYTRPSRPVTCHVRYGADSSR
jgi:hypothetical protein